MQDNRQQEIDDDIKPDKKFNFLRLFMEGIPFGMANTLPGMSGGTVALILYIYEPLIKAIKNINLIFLIPLGVGAGIGALLGASVIDRIFEIYPGLLTALLAGMILASLRVTWHEANKENTAGKKEVFNIILLLAGISLAVILTGNNESGGQAALSAIFLASFFGSITMLLPGISGASLLVALGVYRQVITAIASLDFVVLFFYGLGTVSGLLIFAWLLSWLITRHRRQLMFLLSGLILGSVIGMVPAGPGMTELISFILGFALVFNIISYTRKREHL